MPIFEEGRRTTRNSNLLTSVLESISTMCWVPFSTCNSRFQNKVAANTKDCDIDFPSEVYLVNVHEEDKKLSRVLSKNHTFQTAEMTAVNSSRSSRVDIHSFEAQRIPKTIIISNSDIDASEPSVYYESNENQIHLGRSISSISCASSWFKNASINSSIYQLLDDSQDIVNIASTVTGECSTSSIKKKLSCPLLDSKDSLLSFDCSSHSSDALDLLSFASEDKNVIINSGTDLNHLCEASIQSSYYSGRYDESLFTT